LTNAACIITDPLFLDPAAGDYRLLDGSPCVDAGDNAYVVGDTELAGAARIQGGTVDMGAYEGVRGEYTYTISDGTVTIVRYNGAGGDVVIPGSIEGWPVVAIGRNAFAGCGSLTRAVVPETVTMIDSWAFSGCSRLTNVSFFGNAPAIGVAGAIFSMKTVVYYLRGAVGWGPTFAGRPTAVWGRAPVTYDAGHGSVWHERPDALGVGGDGGGRHLERDLYGDGAGLRRRRGAARDRTGVECRE
jgi:hypothetical protein